MTELTCNKGCKVDSTLKFHPGSYFSLQIKLMNKIKYVGTNLSSYNQNVDLGLSYFNLADKSLLV